MVLLDTDFIFNFFDQNQINHEITKALVEKYVDSQFAITNLVRQELATVLSVRIGYEFWSVVQAGIDEFEVINIFLDENDTRLIWGLFNSFKKKNISFIDCSNLYLAQKHGYKIASFDKFYPREILI